MDQAPRFSERIGQAILARHSFVGSLGWMLVLVIVPTLLRLALDAGHNGVPFVTYFPAIVLGALFLGWRYGVLVTFVSAMVARILFIREDFYFVHSARGLVILVLFVLSCAMLIAIGEALRRVMAEVHAASAREALLNQELRHRLKNLLAVVNSLASLSFRHGNPEEAQHAFSERLAALDRATSLLGGENALTCNLPELAEEALRPFLNDYDIRLDGNRQEVERDACVPAVLAFHELATNAIKYGALSRSSGWVGLSWGPIDDGMVVLRWQEHDGPPVNAPKRRGMGTRILSMRSPAANFKVDYAADGLRCDIALKVA
ncbi:MAG TPA: HWE histidine kinase domain-containing protein [Lacipirellula sp.]|nr:HWE histidine kinase domain-containing protein [Croceibacterium sp.]